MAREEGYNISMYKTINSYCIVIVDLNIYNKREVVRNDISRDRLSKAKGIKTDKTFFHSIEENKKFLL